MLNSNLALEIKKEGKKEEQFSYNYGFEPAITAYIRLIKENDIFVHRIFK